MNTAGLKTYHGSAGTYYVIANKGDNELALNVCIAVQPSADYGLPVDAINRVYGMGLRIRFYDNEHADGEGAGNPFTAFKNAMPWGDCTRIKTFLPVVHAGAGLVGLKTIWENQHFTEKLIGIIKAKVAASGGVMVADSITLQALIELPFEGIPDKAPYVTKEFDLDGHGNNVSLPYGSQGTKSKLMGGEDFGGDDGSEV